MMYSTFYNIWRNIYGFFLRTSPDEHFDARFRTIVTIRKYHRKV